MLRRERAASGVCRAVAGSRASGRSASALLSGRAHPTAQQTLTAGERSRLRAELDGLVAHLYGLTEDEFVHVLAVQVVPLNLAVRSHEKFSIQADEWLCLSIGPHVFIHKIAQHALIGNALAFGMRPHKLNTLTVQLQCDFYRRLFAHQAVWRG